MLLIWSKLLLWCVYIYLNFTDVIIILLQHQKDLFLEIKMQNRYYFHNHSIQRTSIKNIIIFIVVFVGRWSILLRRKSFCIFFYLWTSTLSLFFKKTFQTIKACLIMRLRDEIVSLHHPVLYLNNSLLILVLENTCGYLTLLFYFKFILGVFCIYFISKRKLRMRYYKILIRLIKIIILKRRR